LIVGRALSISKLRSSDNTINENYQHPEEGRTSNKKTRQASVVDASDCQSNRAQRDRHLKTIAEAVLDAPFAARSPWRRRRLSPIHIP
jgi:hypothetical protein